MTSAMILLMMVAAPGDSKIEKVVVFSDRAAVTRIARGTCQDGKASVVFAGLPAGLDVRTLQADADGPAKVIGTMSTLEDGPRSLDAEADALREKLDVVQTRIRELEDRNHRLDEKRVEIGDFAKVLQKTLDEAVRSPRPATDAWAVGLEQLQEQRRTLERDDVEVGRQLAAARLEATRLRRTLERRDASTAHRTATTVVECGATSEAAVRVSYVVAGATWRPEYDLDFTPNGGGKVGEGRARVTVSAVVQQSTGEDWTNARLLLSTSKPRLGSRAPEPAPLYVAGEKGSDQKVLVQAEERRTSLSMGGDVATRAPTSAGLEDKGQSFVISLPRTVTVVADGRPYWMPVDVIETAAKSKLVAVPKLRPFVYQLVELHNPAPYSLLAGRVHSFRKGSYVGDSQLAHRGPGEPLEISLGIDEEVRIERELVDDKNRRSGFLESDKHIEQAFRLVVTSRAMTALTIELRENIPVSKIDDVKVEVSAASTPGYAHDQLRGLLTWVLPLAREEKKTVLLAYTIHLPDDWKVQAR